MALPVVGLVVGLVAAAAHKLVELAAVVVLGHNLAVVLELVHLDYLGDYLTSSFH